MTTPFQDVKIKTLFDTFPPDAREGLFALRELIFAEAAALPHIGPVQEVLRWGQPSYITPERKAATPLRLGTHTAANFAIFTHCQSGVIAAYAARFPCWDKFDGNRAVLFNSVCEVEPFRLGSLVRHALTYHLPDAKARHTTAITL